MFKKKLYKIEYRVHGEHYSTILSSINEIGAIKKFHRLITRNHGYASVVIESFKIYEGV